MGGGVESDRQANPSCVPFRHAQARIRARVRWCGSVSLRVRAHVDVPVHTRGEVCLDRVHEPVCVCVCVCAHPLWKAKSGERRRRSPMRLAMFFSSFEPSGCFLLLLL